MKEALKAYMRRRGETFWNNVFTGNGLCVGNEDNMLKKEWYPNIKTIETGTGRWYYDLQTFKAESFDFVNLGECLEHETSVFTAALAWLHLVKPGGHLVVTVPDFNLYEAKKWPSVFNVDHKWSFSIGGKKEHEQHLSVLEFLSKMPGIQVLRINLADSNYNYADSETDQTLGRAECGIEIVVKKVAVENGSRKTFKHSGARGDLIYSLPTMKMLGGGTLYVNRKKDHYFGVKLLDEEMTGLIEFLKDQPYIDEVKEWDGQEVDFDLDSCRDLDFTFTLISLLYQIRMGINADLSLPWIDTEKIPVICEADIIVSRTERYHSPFDWAELTPWIGKAAFVGSQKEYDEFVKKTGLNIRYLETKTWKELAGVILGSKLFVGNQSFAYSLAEAMKHPRVLEACHFCPNCDPQSDNGHVRLNQGIIRKYLCGENYVDTVRVSKHPFQQRVFEHNKKIVDTYKNVSGVIVGKGPRVKEIEEDFKSEGIETIIAEGETFEKAANSGIEKTTRRIICIVDADLCPDMASIVAVLRSMMVTKAGMISTSMSTYGTPHVSGACIAVSRDTYEKAGLFNLALCSGEAGILEMVLRYSDLGIMCCSLGIPGWKNRPSTESDECRNVAYLERNLGVTV